MSIKKPTKRRVRTITFQPDDDVAEAIEAILKQSPRREKGDKTELINEALRLKLDAAARVIEAQEKAAQAARDKEKG